MIQVIYRSGSSACFELDGNTPYYSNGGYTVLVDGEERFQRDTNVFSLYGLKPDTRYAVSVRFADGGEEQIELETPPETCCVNVQDFGAAGDGVHEDTAAIQAAISFLPEGGRLWFPAGTYLTLPLCLKSHITLDLDEGAVILGSTDRARYPIIPSFTADPVTGRHTLQAGFEGQELNSYQSLIQAAYAEDIAIVGRGAIDGNGQNGDWWKDFKSFPASRPRVLFLSHTKNVTLHGVTVKNGPSWHIHPFYSQNFAMLDCFVTAPKDSPNTDGIDPESCDGVNIIGCRFSVGDDCIAVKAGKIDMALKYRTPADRHTIRNCLMEFGHGAVTLGSELSAGIRNLSVTRCYFRATDRGLRIKTRRGRGKDSVIDSVLFDGIRMDKVLTPIVINMWYNCCDPDRYTEYVWCRDPLPVDDRTPHLGAFAFRNMECTGAEVAACYIDGLPESPIDEVALENISVSFAEDARPGKPSMKNQNQDQCRLGLYLDNVRKIRVKNVELHGVQGKALITEHCGDVFTEDFEGLLMDYKKIDEFVLQLVERSTPERTAWNMEKIREGKPASWNYIDGCMLTALMEMEAITGDERYSGFVKACVDHFVGQDGSIRTFKPEAHNLDDINEGRVLFALYARTGEEKYRRAADFLRERLEEQPRTQEGNFWHKAIYPNQVWLDGIYMAQPFYALYEKHFGSGDCSDTAAQIKNVRAKMFSEEKGLYFHGYDASRAAFWADPVTGCSKNFWLRSLGWFAVALADLLEILPDGGNRDSLRGIFTELMGSAGRYADPETGMYWQVPDQGGRAGNYLEASGSAMMAYAMLKGARLGVLDAACAVQGRKTFDGILEKYLTFTESGLDLGGICLVAGLGPENNRRRDGSYEYYISEPVVKNDAKGVAPFVLAYTEVKRLKRLA